MAVILAAVVALAALSAIVWLRRARKLRLPPGPKPLPIVGNVLDMPSSKPWEKYSEWSKEYATDVLYLRLPMQDVMILSSFKAVTDLFVKRSQIYSDRPRSAVMQLMQCEDLFAMASYTASWRDQRKALHPFLSQSTVSQFRQTQLHQARCFLTWVNDSPKDVRKHIRRWITSNVVEVIYGKTVSGMEDPYIIMAEKAVEGISKAHIPGIYWIDYFPLLKYIPSWAPGATSRRFAEHYAPYIRKLRDVPYDEVKTGIEAGTARSSIATHIAEDIQARYGGTEEQAIQDELAKMATCTLYGGKSIG
ncbi:hypothetical protein EIP91_008274 [Steccherinum ochraceum]|uniref:Cytochrome P450-dit2 n=1 Tax=Steccherinum ochraceum TaxID=92696 RepID=A0A4R0R320_9APHY|nr:hypothetical protein EIP91_008274 [Steccherinum ochraceum]